MDKDEIKEIASQLDVGLMEFSSMLETLVELVNDLKFILRLGDIEDDS
jgi:hypothetical protein